MPTTANPEIAASGFAAGPTNTNIRPAAADRQNACACAFCAGFQDYVVIIPGADRVEGVCGQSAQLLAELGATIIACGPKKTGEDLAELCRRAKLRTNAGGEVVFVQGDASAPGFMTKLTSDVVERFGRVDGLLPIGVVAPEHDGGILEITCEEMDALKRNNERLVVRSCQAALPHMMNAGFGRVVLANSKSATAAGFAGQYLYAASKAIVVPTAATINGEFAERYNIYCNVGLLGTITNGGQSNRRRLGENPDHFLAIALAGLRGRCTTDAEAAFVISWLLHPRNPLVGVTIEVDGGESAAGTMFRGPNWRDNANRVLRALQAGGLVDNCGKRRNDAPLG